MGSNSNDKAEKQEVSPKTQRGSSALKQIIVEGIATAYSTTPAAVEADLQESEADFDLAEVCDALEEFGY